MINMITFSQFFDKLNSNIDKQGKYKTNIEEIEYVKYKGEMIPMNKNWDFYEFMLYACDDIFGDSEHK